MLLTLRSSQLPLPSLLSKPPQLAKLPYVALLRLLPRARRSDSLQWPGQ
jgi:hypothetical protein